MAIIKKLCKKHIKLLTKPYYVDNIFDMMTHNNIIKLLKSLEPDIKIDQPRISRIFSGDEGISLLFASCLNKLCPDKSLIEWKNTATSDEIKQVFSELETVSICEPS